MSPNNEHRRQSWTSPWPMSCRSTISCTRFHFRRHRRRPAADLFPGGAHIVVEMRDGEEQGARLNPYSLMIVAARHLGIHHQRAPRRCSAAAAHCSCTGSVRPGARAW